jgi:hypothetical protein
MATIRLPLDFKEFLALLNSEKVEYLLLGGYAVGIYGYPRATGDMDVWVASHPANAERVVAALQRFGFSDAALLPQLFLKEERVFRIGIPRLRIVSLTSVSGIEFPACYARRTVAELEGVRIDLLSLPDLKANKKASGRAKDLNDLEHLP